MAKPFAVLRAAYQPKIERLGLDFGLATLIATGEGSPFGAGLINDLKRIDKQIVGIAATPPGQAARHATASVTANW
jgi:hypothetical protein